MTLKLNGSSSGHVSLDAKAAAASNTLTLPDTANGELIAKDSSGNVGIGTTSPNAPIEITNTSVAQLRTGYNATKYGNIGRKSNGDYEFASYENGSNIVFGTGTSDGSTNDRVKIDSSGHVNIGCNTSANPLTYLRFGATQLGAADIRPVDDGSHKVGLAFYVDGNTSSIAPAEKARFMSHGLADPAFLVGTTSNAINTSAFGIGLYYDGTIVNSRNVGGGNGVIFFNGNGGSFHVRGDGDVLNTNNSYGQISDQTLKQDIVDAGSQWDDIKNVKVRKFRFKDNASGPLQIGVVAQEIETISPGLVKEGYKDKDESGDKVKSVKYSVLYMKAIKALQEAMAKIEVLETKVAALEGS